VKREMTKKIEKMKTKENKRSHCIVPVYEINTQNKVSIIFAQNQREKKAVAKLLKSFAFAKCIGGY
jgi:hypothetical protein